MVWLIGLPPTLLILDARRGVEGVVRRPGGVVGLEPPHVHDSVGERRADGANEVIGERHGNLIVHHAYVLLLGVRTQGVAAHLCVREAVLHFLPNFRVGIGADEHARDVPRVDMLFNEIQLVVQVEQPYEIRAQN